MTKWIESLLDGAGRALDLSGGARARETRPRTDAEALAGDWKRVGDDLRTAMRRADEELRSKQP